MIGAAICLGTAVLIAYFLGRYQGMAAAFESLRPTLPRNRETTFHFTAEGSDVRTARLVNELFHNGTVLPNE